jgi:hypothetical protein
MAEPVAVHIDCPCPGTPHPNGDTVYLRPTPGLVGGVMIRNRYVDISTRLYALQQRGEMNDTDTAEATGQLLETYLRAGIASWTLVDEQGQPVEVTRDSITAFEEHWQAATVVADRADDLYKSVVLDPLRMAGSTSSNGSPTTASTSATNGNGTTRRQRRSKRSLTSTSPTAGTVTIIESPAGGSSS